MARFNFGRFFGKTLTDAAGYAAGTATAKVLEPPLQNLANEAWALNPVVPPEAVLLAEGVAQGQVSKARAYKWAAESGIGTEQMDALVNIANTGPPLGSALQSLRRGDMSEADYRVALTREAIEPRWFDALVKLAGARLSLAEVGNGVQQGHLPDDGILPPPVTVGPPFDIPLTTIEIDPLEEAASWGIDEERLKVIANLSGLPPGEIELAHMFNRGIITEAAFEAGIREGHRKTKWIPAVKELRHAVLSATQYVEARVRGWIDDGAMVSGGALTGYSPAQMDMLFKIHGRPLSWHQIFIGLARGGVYDGPTDAIDPAFLKGLQESNIRPEWYHLAWAQRYNYPAPFVLRKLASDGDLTEAETEQVLLYEGWEPTFAAKVAHKWATTTPAGTKGKGLTAAEIRAARNRGTLTDAEALQRLEALHYSAADAAIFLANLPPPQP